MKLHSAHNTWQFRISASIQEGISHKVPKPIKTFIARTKVLTVSTRRNNWVHAVILE